ncbi:MAG TPA: phospholipid-binding protein [Trichocoleus sp.]
MSSLVTTGAVINGVCYAKPFSSTEVNVSLQTIPPERVGLRGEYDHDGLAKRVRLRYYKAVGSDAIANLAVKQRGSVVILHGQVDSQSLLEQLIQLAIQVEGTTNVEVREVKVIQPA